MWIWILTLMSSGRSIVQTQRGKQKMGSLGLFVLLQLNIDLFFVIQGTLFASAVSAVNTIQEEVLRLNHIIEELFES